jgi:hypothetical protein
VDFFVRMQAVVLSFGAGTGAYQPAPEVATYDDAYGEVYADVAPPDTFFDELDGAGDWYEDDSYGAVFVPSRPQTAPCYQDAARYGSWVDRPSYGRVWVPEQRYRRHVVARVRPHVRRVVVNPYSQMEQRERTRLIRYLDQLSAREWRRLERSGASHRERQRLQARQDRRRITELRRLEQKQATRRYHR